MTEFVERRQGSATSTPGRRRRPSRPEGGAARRPARARAARRSGRRRARVRGTPRSRPPRRHALDAEASLRVAHGERVVLEHHHVGDHARVDVAVDGHQPGPLERDAARRVAAAILAEVERVQRRDREHVVVDAVAVRERDRLPGHDREDARPETLALLHELGRPGGRRAREASQVDHHAGVVVARRGAAEERLAQHAHLAFDHPTRLRPRGRERQREDREQPNQAAPP